MTVFYDNSERERVENINKFRTKMRTVKSGLEPGFYMKRCEYFDVYSIYKRPDNWLLAFGNFVLNGVPMEKKQVTIQLHSNSSVHIKMYGDMDIAKEIAEFLDKDDFRVTVTDHSLQEIAP